MRIDSLPPLLARSLTEALPRAQAAFSPTEEHAAPAAAPATAAAMPGTQTNPVPSVAMLVTMAAVDDGKERRRRIAEDAARGLDALERLHRELVSGAASPARLAEIAQWSRDHAVSEDPTLAALLKDIDLRVRVELAKFDIEA
ncbi:MAG: flagellar assembly protein FliX [Sphingomonas bacterium]